MAEIITFINQKGGVGKTTTIGKLAAAYTKEGKKVLLVAGDTFRAAAADQLSIWADRAGCGIVRHEEGSDPAAVVYDGCAAAKARHAAGSPERKSASTAGSVSGKPAPPQRLRKTAHTAT